MSWKGTMYYLTNNSFLLLIPVFLWNLILASRLPEAYQMPNFWKNIPGWIGIGENAFRALVFLVPLFLKLGSGEGLQKFGWFLYLLGLSFYFTSWLLQIYFPESAWSRSAWGFLAPAYTTIIWLFGIGLIGKQLWIKIPYHYSIYLLLVVGFVFFHSLHAYLVYSRI